MVLGSYWYIPKEWTANHQIVFCDVNSQFKSLRFNKSSLEQGDNKEISTFTFCRLFVIDVCIESISAKFSSPLSPFGYIHFVSKDHLQKMFCLGFSVPWLGEVDWRCVPTKILQVSETCSKLLMLEKMCLGVTSMYLPTEI